MWNARPLSFESPHEIVNCPGRGTDEVTDGASAPRRQRWTLRLRCGALLNPGSGRGPTRVVACERHGYSRTLRMLSFVLPGSIENLTRELAFAGLCEFLKYFEILRQNSLTSNTFVTI